MVERIRRFDDVMLDRRRLDSADALCTSNKGPLSERALADRGGAECCHALFKASRKAATPHLAVLHRTAPHYPGISPIPSHTCTSLHLAPGSAPCKFASCKLGSEKGTGNQSSHIKGAGLVWDAGMDEMGWDGTD